LEVLGESLVYKEQEVLNSFRDKLEETDLEGSHFDKKGLLDNSSSSDEESGGLRHRGHHLLTEDKTCSDDDDEETKGF